MTGSLILFYVAAAFVISGGIGVVVSKNIVYCAFSLLVSMIGIAGVFLLAFAEFLALVQILIYGGAVVNTSRLTCHAASLRGICCWGTRAYL